MERSCITVKIATRPFNGLSITLISQAMNEKRAKLTENVSWYVPWSLCCDCGGQSIFPTFFCDKPESI
jgi:hypothetical protein